MRASGAGGQHVNTTDSAVRVTHLETGISAKVGKSRSQASNRQKALDLLRARLIEHYLSARRKTAEGVSEQTGQAVINREDQHFGMRIRTYNEFYNEAVDHRSDFRAPVHQILDGDLREMLRHNLLVL